MAGNSLAKRISKGAKDNVRPFGACAALGQRKGGVGPAPHIGRVSLFGDYL